MTMFARVVQLVAAHRAAKPRTVAVYTVLYVHEVERKFDDAKEKPCT